MRCDPFFRNIYKSFSCQDLNYHVINQLAHFFILKNVFRYVKLVKASKFIQTKYRANKSCKIQRQKYLKFRSDVILVQSQIRRFLAFKQLCSLREQRELALKQLRAALLIQVSTGSLLNLCLITLFLCIFCSFSIVIITNRVAIKPGVRQFGQKKNRKIWFFKLFWYNKYKFLWVKTVYLEVFPLFEQQFFVAFYVNGKVLKNSKESTFCDLFCFISFYHFKRRDYFIKFIEKEIHLLCCTCNI